MERVYLDSSALVKNYVQEPGSGAVENLLLTTPAECIFLAATTGAEVVAALARRQKSGTLSSDDATRAIRSFRASWSNAWTVLQVDYPVVELAMDLAQRHGLRGYDAIQLACACDLAQDARDTGDAVALWSSDAELLTATQLEGLHAVNPAAPPTLSALEPEAPDEAAVPPAGGRDVHADRTPAGGERPES